MRYKERMVGELLHLNHDITLLESKLSDENIDSGVSKEKQELMRKQLEAMYQYEAALRERVLLEMN